MVAAAVGPVGKAQRCPRREFGVVTPPCAGRPSCARARRPAVLAPVYDWFTEGFASLGLRDANALRDELT
jgi:hypothetical protein